MKIDNLMKVRSESKTTSECIKSKHGEELKCR